MKKVLFLPFLQISSGHHQVAEALIASINMSNSTVYCEKEDILTYSYGKIESIISFIYLNWIRYFPNTYNWLYKKSVYTHLNKSKNFRIYELLFLKAMIKLIKEKDPQLVICTHALPSYMVNKLKQQRIITIPVINVYTDFFIHKFWGIDHVNYHFVAHEEMSQYLQSKGIKKEKIFVTGIPIHYHFQSKVFDGCANNELKGLIMGGSLGVGNVENLLNSITADDPIKYLILCGKNKRLFQSIERLNLPNVKPLPYIHSREEMNHIYSNSHFVITKPGGVTISECIFKGLPVFIHHILPGQEEINYQHLVKLGVVFPLKDWHKNGSLSKQIQSYLMCKSTMDRFQQSCQTYKTGWDLDAPIKIISQIL